MHIVEMSKGVDATTLSDTRVPAVEPWEKTSKCEVGKQIRLNQMVKIQSGTWRHGRHPASLSSCLIQQAVWKSNQLTRTYQTWIEENFIKYLGCIQSIIQATMTI